MVYESRWEDDRFLWKAFMLSLALHTMLFRMRGLALPRREDRYIEVDITHVGLPGTRAGLQKTVPHGPPAPKRKRVIAPPVPADSIAVPTNKAAPKPSEPAAEPSAPSPAMSPGAGEYGVGDGSRNVLSQMPRLINLDELIAILKRFYPEAARGAGREGTVVLDIHIDPEGHVTAADVVRSAGSDFDSAAIRASKLLRFTPAYLGSQRVAVKMRQAIEFKLEG